MAQTHACRWPTSETTPFPVVCVGSSSAKGSAGALKKNEKQHRLVIVLIHCKHGWKNKFSLSHTQNYNQFIIILRHQTDLIYHNSCGSKKVQLIHHCFEIFVNCRRRTPSIDPGSSTLIENCNQKNLKNFKLKKTQSPIPIEVQGCQAATNLK